MSTRAVAVSSLPRSQSASLSGKGAKHVSASDPVKSSFSAGVSPFELSFQSHNGYGFAASGESFCTEWDNPGISSVTDA